MMNINNSIVGPPYLHISNPHTLPTLDQKYLEKNLYSHLLHAGKKCFSLIFHFFPLLILLESIPCLINFTITFTVKNLERFASVLNMYRHFSS
jgi:hypothetical protein